MSSCEGWCGRTQAKCALCPGTVPIPQPLSAAEQRELNAPYVPPPPVPVPKHISRLLKKQYRKTDFEQRFSRFIKDQNTNDLDPEEEDSSSEEPASPLPVEQDSGNWVEPYCYVCGHHSPTTLCRKCELLVKRTHRQLLL